MSDLTKKLEALSRYSPFVNGTAFMGMLRKMGEKRYGPGYSPDSYGEYILASDIDALLASEAREEPRDAVRRFADWMETRLSHNDEKGGWDSCTDTFLFNSARQNLAQAAAEKKDMQYKVEALVDCANFCMMIYDNLKRKLYAKKEAPYDK